MKLVVVSSLLTSLAQGISSPQTENCPLAVSSPFKFRWKENYARKKIASYKPVRSKLLKKLQKLGQVPDFANNGWTMLLKFDNPVSHGTFDLNFGYGLSTNKEGSMIAFHSHEWNKDLLINSPHWFEAVFDFPDSDGPAFNIIGIDILEGEYSNVQCLFDANDFTNLGMTSDDGQNVVNHLNDAETITEIWNGVVPKSSAYSCSAQEQYRGATECACENGTGDTLLTCSGNDCIACSDGYDVDNGICVTECPCTNGVTGQFLSDCTGVVCSSCDSVDYQLDNGVCAAECPCTDGTGEFLADCTNSVCTACNTGFDLIDSEYCQDQSITAAQDEVNARLDAAGAAKCVEADCLGITIMWDNTVTTNDLDIYVYTPNGNTIYYSQKSHDGGVLDIDARESTASPIENVIFENGAPAGNYRIEVKNYQANHSSTKDFILALQKPGESTRTIYNFQMSGTSKEIIEVANFDV